MDTTFQDIHIYNRRNKQEIVYRQIRISKILFEKEVMYILYKDHNNVDMAMEIPKQRYVSLTID